MAEGSQKQSEPKLTMDQLLANARNLTGHPAHVLEAALADSDRKTHTVAAAKRAGDQFLKHEDTTGSELEEKEGE